MLRRLMFGAAVSCGLWLLIGACGGGEDEDVPECRQVLSSCTDPCEITCPAGTEEACAGPDYGFDIAENERCCFCAPVPRDSGY